MLFIEKLTPEKSVIFKSSKERIYNINTFSLEKSDDSKDNIDVYCECNKKKESFKICSLKKNKKELYNTDINFGIHTFKDIYEIKLKTKCKNVIVNVIGFYEEEEEEEGGPKTEGGDKPTKVKNKNENKIIEKELDNISDVEEDNVDKEHNESSSNSEENEILENNGPNVSLVDLLNKKRKEEPQDLKPITLKNLNQEKKDKNIPNKKIKLNKDKK